MDTKYIYRCEDTTECILTAIYDAWASVHKHEENRIEVCLPEGESQLTFAEYIDVTADTEKSEKVARSVRNRISEEAYDMIMKAALSDDPEKGEVMYRFLIYAFKEGAKACRSYGNPFAMKVFELVRNYNNETHLLKGFLRFEEYGNGLLLAKFAPQNNITVELMEHFSDRLNTEDFMIFDEKRKIVGVHRSASDWFMHRLSEEEYQDMIDVTKQKDDFVGLWKVFFQKIAIKERTNYKLQRNNLPIRFRSHMTEFQ